jgi:plasmid stabilization system protein ParE
MAVRIIWSPLAEQDFKSAIAYIRKDNFNVAEAWRKSMLAEVELLSGFPELGRIVPQQKDTSLREIIYRPYRIVYRYAHTGDTVQIIRVWHAARGEPEMELKA